MRAVWFVMLIAGCWRQAPPEPLHDPPRRERPRTVRTGLSSLARSLAEVEMFALGGVGFTGEKSEGEVLALALAREPDARIMFERLAVDPNRVARLYAYWALRTLDPDAAQRHRTALASDGDAVTTMHGCIVSSARVASVVADIDALPPGRALPRS